MTVWLESVKVSALSREVLVSLAASKTLYCYLRDLPMTTG